MKRKWESRADYDHFRSDVKDDEVKGKKGECALHEHALYLPTLSRCLLTCHNIRS